MSAVGLRLPLFDLPDHVYIPFQRRGCLCPGFFVLANRREADRVRSTLEELGPHEVVRRFPGLWLNRDPYSAYRNLNWHSTFEDGLPPSVDLAVVLPALVPLQEVAGFTIAEVYYRLTWRQRFFAACLDGHSVPIEVDVPNAPRVRCMDFLSVAAAVPAKAPTPKPPRQSWCSLAVSATELAPNCNARLLEGLREFEGWFAHEAVADRGLIRFQLGFASQHRAKARDLIAACLPRAQAKEVSDPGSPSHLYRLEAVPEFPPGAFNLPGPLSAGSVGNLLKIFAEIRPCETACVQVLFAPMGLDFFGCLWAELKAITHQSLASKKMEQLGSKFPGWRMAVRLYSSERAVLERIVAEWLLPYESSTRRWLISSVRPTSGIDRTVETWEVADTAELAGFIDFPTDLAG